MEYLISKVVIGDMNSDEVYVEFHSSEFKNNNNGSKAEVIADYYKSEDLYLLISRIVTGIYVHDTGIHVLRGHSVGSGIASVIINNEFTVSARTSRESFPAGIELEVALPEIGSNRRGLVKFIIPRDVVMSNIFPRASYIIRNDKVGFIARHLDSYLATSADVPISEYSITHTQDNNLKLHFDNRGISQMDIEVTLDMLQKLTVAFADSVKANTAPNIEIPISVKSVLISDILAAGCISYIVDDTHPCIACEILVCTDTFLELELRFRFVIKRNGRETHIDWIMTGNVLSCFIKYVIQEYYVGIKQIKQEENFMARMALDVKSPKKSKSDNPFDTLSSVPQSVLSFGLPGGLVPKIPTFSIPIFMPRACKSSDNSGNLISVDVIKSRSRKKYVPTCTACVNSVLVCPSCKHPGGVKAIYMAGHTTMAGDKHVDTNDNNVFTAVIDFGKYIEYSEPMYKETCVCLEAIFENASVRHMTENPGIWCDNDIDYHGILYMYASKTSDIVNIAIVGTEMSIEIGTTWNSFDSASRDVIRNIMRLDDSV